MTHFRKKPVVIEAKQATGTPESNREIIDWTRGCATPVFMDSEVRNCSAEHPEGFDYPVLKINTLEGTMTVKPGDWIIKGVKGEFYPCKPDIFAATYEAAQPATAMNFGYALDANKAPRITPADIEANIASEHYFTARDGRLGALTNEAYVGRERPMEGDADLAPLGLLTFCVLVLRNGFTVTGESACASPENFNAEIGKRVARENAVQKIWPLMGYELKTKLANT